MTGPTMSSAACCGMAAACTSNSTPPTKAVYGISRSNGRTPAIPACYGKTLICASVTLMLLWEEYSDTTADGFSYSWFCERYKEWAGRLKLTLRQVHVAGEKLFVDYSGHTMEVIDGLTGEVLTTQIFVAVLGASNYTYAEATFTQSLPDWISSHVRAFSFFSGVARQTVSDNLKA